MMDQIKAELVSWWGGDRDVANQAWASSTDKEKLSVRSNDDVRRLVTQVAHLHHDTPKERVWMDFYLSAPISTERQFDKYRMTVQYQDFQVEFSEVPFGRWGTTQNEMSGRYRTIPGRHQKLPDDVRGIMDRGINSSQNWTKWWDLIHENAHASYQATLDGLKMAQARNVITNFEYKRAREVLRGMLGTAFLTDWRLVCNMNAFEHIMNQRLKPDAQMEARVLAARMLKAVREAGVAPDLVANLEIVNEWNKMIPGGAF